MADLHPSIRLSQTCNVAINQERQEHGSGDRQSISPLSICLAIKDLSLESLRRTFTPRVTREPLDRQSPTMLKRECRFHLRRDLPPRKERNTLHRTSVVSLLLPTSFRTETNKILTTISLKHPPLLFCRLL